MPRSTGYQSLIIRLKALGSKYISWSPQCIDSHITKAIIKNAPIDYLFVQYYNTPFCSAKSFINNPSSTGFQDSFTYYATSRPGIKVLIGLPASTAAANPDHYLTIAQVHTLLATFGSNANFAGIDLWEATQSQLNLICGREYATWMKM